MEILKARKTLIQVGIWLALAALMASMVLSETISIYTSYSVGLAAVYGMAVLSVSLLAGWSGIWSVAHPALLAVGAYFGAYGSSHGWSLEVTFLGAALACAVLGAFLGFAGSRFSILYVALLTLAFTLVAVEVIVAWRDVTGGDSGVPVSFLSSAFGDIYAGSKESVALAVGAFGAALAIATAMRSTSLRMRLVAAKSQPLASRTIGIAPEAQSTLAFAVSAAVTGIAGVLLGLLSGFVSPESFSLVLAINIIAAAVLGGPGSIAGAVLGGAFLAWAPTLAREASIDQPFLVGGLLILALIFLPLGVVPTITNYLSRFLPARTRTTSDGEIGEAIEAILVEAAAHQGDAEGAVTVLEVDDLGVKFGGLEAVRNASVTVSRGEVLAIIGPNGAGKTTFVNALSGLTMGGKVSGNVTLLGSKLTGVKAARRRSRGLGRTFQHAELFSELTVIENVLATQRFAGRKGRERALESLRVVGLEEEADSLPTSLPFGLQKRVDLARALAESPRLLVLDEPFGGLDDDERRLFSARIVQLSKSGTSIIIIDHVLEDLMQVADRVIAFDFGEIIAEGSSDTVLQNEQVRTSYLGTSGTAVPAPVVPPSAPVLIELSAVSHRYEGVTALDNIDLTVSAGSILGVVGTNGAGKSTLGRLLHGSMKSSAGTRIAGMIDGHEPRISLVPEGRALFKTLSIKENLEVAGYAVGLTGSKLQRRLDTTFEWLPPRIAARQTVAAGALSGGEQQLVAIARALMAEPDVIILDEPALGLSPAMVDEVYGEINRLAQQGVTAVLLDQLLSRALRACSSLVVVRNGQIVAQGSVRESGFEKVAEQAYFGHGPSDGDIPTSERLQTTP